MAFASSSAVMQGVSSLGVFLLPPSEKLTYSNHVLGKRRSFLHLEGVACWVLGPSGGTSRLVLASQRRCKEALR
jgi:hypothetical protein